MHGRAHAVTVAEVDIVAHADFVAVVKDRGARKAEQKRVQQFDAAAVVVNERRKPAADADVDAHARVGRISEVHVIALIVGDHFQSKFVVVAQEQAPLAVIWNRRRLRHDVGDGQPVFLPECHVDARHEREVKGHVALVTIAEVGPHIRRPLIGLGQDETIRIVGIDGRADFLDDDVGLGQVLATGAIAFAKIRNRVHAKRIHAHVEPEAHGLEDFLDHHRVVEIEIRLMGEEAMPVVSVCGFIPGPVGLLGVCKDDARVLVFLVGIGPHIHVALR